MAERTVPAAPALVATGLSRTYRSGGSRLAVLRDVSLAVTPGEVVAVTGPSGSGKTTLLFLLAGLDEPDAGTVEVAGLAWSRLRGRRRAQHRRRSCGFIAQGASLHPAATAAENVEVPLLLDHVGAPERRSRVEEALAAVGLDGHGPKLPDQLSGGQQQRVAIARALVGVPAVVLADEPTASLDSTSAAEVTDLLVACGHRRGVAVVLVTHDPQVAARADRELRLRAGRWAVPEPAS